ncbi:hypothetical protein DYB37_005571 [Aphanomyces astaci]|uniref:PH domain-containing protein n=1 Tax=Aphanomyces astaci TaxID=112090 RepID=A0A418F815_APHAT|nr:hypothetical protein DYB35_005511 [Aphanomyces astaci]RHZ25169.1 hypothetical protein DYB37_005571 [Aphanomyces astaci]
MFDVVTGYVPTTPPLRVRANPTKSKKKLSRLTKEQRELLAQKYANNNNQSGEHRPEASNEDNNLSHDTTGETLSYDDAATKIQNAWRCHFACQLKARLQAQIGRPAQLHVHKIHVSAKWLRLGAYCIVTVLRRPYGPLMYQYKTDLTKQSALTSQAPFFVPIMSAKYDVIVTVVAEPSKLQYPVFLGQAVLAVDDSWADDHQVQRNVLFQGYRFPVDVQLQNSDRHVEGHVVLSLVSLNASVTSFSGPLAVRPSGVTKTLASMRHRVGKLYMKNGMSYESALSWCQKAPDILQWGVLTDTFLSIYHQRASLPHKSFDLRRIQLIHHHHIARSDDGHNKEVHQLKIYHEGIIHTFGVESSYEYRQWVYRIDANRRKLLVP